MGKRIVPFGIGLVIVVVAIALTVWNERRTAGRAEQRLMAEAEMVEAAAERIEARLEGHIVRVVGTATAEGEVVEPDQGRTLPFLRVERLVETVQWRERQIVTQGGRDLTYELVWSAERIDSTTFRDAGGAHPNPPLRLRPARYLAPSPKIGAWSADDALWHAIPATEPVSLPDQIQLASVGAVRRIGAWWWSGDPDRPVQGDVRLRYLAVPLTQVTLIGRAASGRIQPVGAEEGEKLSLAAVGDVPAERLLEQAGIVSTVEAWKLRALALAGFLMGSLILASGMRRLAPEVLGRFGGRVPPLGALLGITLWLIASVTVWLLFRVA